MTISEWPSRFSALELRISREMGPFTLFALLMREDSPDRWDLIVAAPWTEPDRQQLVAYLVKQIKNELGDEWLTYLSRIVVADPKAEAIQAINRSISVEHGDVELKDTNLFGVQIKHGHIITSKLPPSGTATQTGR